MPNTRKPTFCFANIETDGRLIHLTKANTLEGNSSASAAAVLRESYRLSTFQDFPRNVAVNVCILASHGFYYTGCGDRVTCFSCEQTVEDWNLSDDPTSAEWHKLECKFVNGRDTKNIPVSLSRPLFVRQRSPDQASSSQTRNISLPSNLQITSTSQTNQNSENLVSFTNISGNHHATSSSGINVETSSGVRISFQNSSRRNHIGITARSIENELFPCLQPAHPHMRREASRLQTFQDCSTRWPAYRIRATPREMTKSGLFFLGDRDRVKCWYCNGGLQNWERDDDPWEEHAKWYPHCEFVLQRKGLDFVHRISARFPNLRRPILRDVPQTSVRSMGAGPSNLSSSQSTRSSSSQQYPIIVNEMEEGRRRSRKIEQEMALSPQVSQARIMGFEEGPIRAALTKQYQRHNQGFSSLENLLEAILSPNLPYPSNQDEEAVVSNNEGLPPNGIDPNISVSNISTEFGIREIRRLEEQRLCKICRREPASVVFIPCGHITCCVACGANIQSNCPACDRSVSEKLHSYVV